ncbi:MAG: hypothetical protein L0H96_18570 [Humibacillus sp.]|nr:hypothetical protein [Humibacillus sp.]MDN5778903.1 hypothetical protein [Humibacillus sp.]
MSSTSVIASLAISNTTYNALLFLLPLSSYVFGSRYILHDFHIKLIARYIVESLSARLGGNLRWENWKADEMQASMRAPRAPTVVRWNVLQPTRLTFEGVAVTAFLAAGVVSVMTWAGTGPSWHLAAGLSILWVLDALAILSLHMSFRRSS